MMAMLLPLLITLNAASSNHALAPPSSSAFLVKSLTNNKEWTPTSLMMMPPRIVGATPTPLLFGADSGRRANGSRKNNHRHRDCITNNNFLMMVRGGGGGEDADDTTTTDDDDDDDDGDSSDDSDGDESYEYDRTSSSDDETDTDGDDDAEANLSCDDEEDDIATDEENEEEINRPTEEQIENARNSSALASQSRNFGIATALWASLFFDAILNTAKRSDLFTSGASSSLSTTSVPTALLASGFGLASAASFLLWRDMEIEADAMGAEDGRSDKGDRHLSLSSSANDDDDDDEGEGDYRREEASKMFASRTRTRLCLHLSLFGALSLGANAGRYFTAEAPFLGMTGVIINAHNVLACAAAVWKEERAKDGLGPTKWLIGLFRGDEEGGMEKKEKSGMSSLIFRVVALGVWARCIQLSKGVLILGTDLLATGAGVATESSIAVVDDARRLCLQIASLARLTLVAGVSRTLCVSTGKAGRRIGFGRHPFFNVLSAVLGVGCLSVGGTVLFDAFGPLTSASNASMAVGGGILVVLFGLFAGYNSVSGFLANAKRSVQ